MFSLFHLWKEKQIAINSINELNHGPMSKNGH